MRIKLCTFVRSRASLLLGGLICAALGATCMAQNTAYERPPIDYPSAPVHDAVNELSQKLQRGEVTLAYDEKFGYLPSILSELDIPMNSQTLVFSKTSLQLRRISPRRPRALYFNDDVYVGYCQYGDMLELAATDPQQGAIFYSLEQDAESGPMIRRDNGTCLTCHVSSRTQGVPGFLMRSVFPDGTGRPKAGTSTFTSKDSSPFEDRWGGWYVTGQHGSMRHMGNSICTTEQEAFDRAPGANVLDLSDKFRTENYLATSSDIVALMVLQHQTQMHNSITSANYATRLALHQSFEMNEFLERPKGHVSDSAQRRISNAADQVLKHLLFCEEFRLTAAVTGSSSFAQDFEARGRQTPDGRSLRQLDLQTRLFKYPCSYLIYSEAFTSLPNHVRTLILRRLAKILSGDNQDETYAHLDSDTRHAIQEILRATLPEFAPLASADAGLKN